MSLKNNNIEDEKTCWYVNDFLKNNDFSKGYFSNDKDMVMEEYLSDITNDMIVCLIRAGSVIIKCKNLKAFLTIRDGVKGNSIEFAYEKNKKTLEKSKPKFSKADGFTALSTRSTPYLDDGCSIKNDIIANSNEEGKLCTDKNLAKSGKISEKAKITTEIERHKLVTSKPCFLHQFQLTILLLILFVLQSKSQQSPMNFVHLQYYSFILTMKLIFFSTYICSGLSLNGFQNILLLTQRLMTTKRQQEFSSQPNNGGLVCFHF